MKQLTGMDEMFLSVDTARTTGVMGGLVIFEKPRTKRAGSAAAMTERLEQRIAFLPPFRWQLAKVPFGIDHHYWAEVGQVAVAEHVRTVSVPEPGRDEDLAQAVAAIMETPLDLTRPPWELVVFEGLSEGRVAHLIRIHHGLIDGTSIPRVLDILSDSPSIDLSQAPETPPADRFTGVVGMAARGVVGLSKRPGKVAALQVRTARYFGARMKDDGLLAPMAYAARVMPTPKPLRGLLNRRQRKAEQPEITPLLPTLRKPRTPFNGRVEAGRSFAFSDLPLADFKRVGKTFGGTLNDVVLAVVAGALRTHLAERGELPEKPLVVCIPASIHPVGAEGAEDGWGNSVSMFFAELPTDVADPVERIHAAHDRVAAQKANFDALPTHLFRDASDMIPIGVWTIPQKLLSKAPGWVPTSQWNIVVSNVRGPSEPVKVTGATMTGYWPAAFLTMGVGLNVTLQSYVDRVDFGFMGASNLTGDLAGMPAHMERALAELLAAADAQA